MAQLCDVAYTLIVESLRRDHDTNRLASALAGQDVGDFDQVQGRVDEWLRSELGAANPTSSEEAELRAALRLPRE